MNEKKDIVFNVVIGIMGCFISALCGMNLWVLSGLDSKVFTHLTNHEIHIPRTQVVDSAIYELHCKQNDEVYKMILEEIRANRAKLDTIQMKVTELTK
jgi:hypothetical protein